MKKCLLLFLLLPLMAAASFAQESRQDVSGSVTGIFQPYSSANAVRRSPGDGIGVLGSYRYMLTPRSAAEANYQYSQYTDHFSTSSLPNIGVHARFQEISVAYVFSFTFRKFNPFLEGGVGAFLFSPIDDPGTKILDKTRTTSIGALYGAGIAYEISPSFDIRAEYRGIVAKSPNFGDTTISTNRYGNISEPTVGVAYHF